MKRASICATVRLYTALWVFAAACAAQSSQPAGPPRAVLAGEAKLRYILKQLDLSAEQARAASELLATYRTACEAERTAAQDRTDRMKAVMTEMQAAEKAGDDAKAAALRRQLDDLRLGAAPERAFYAALEPMLTAEQKATLSATRERLRVSPVVELTPLDVVRTARAQGLSPEQAARLDAEIAALRKRQEFALPGDPNVRAKLLEDFVHAVRRILDADQAAKFDAAIARLTPDATSP